MIFVRRVALARPGAPAIIQGQDNRVRKDRKRSSSHSGKGDGSIFFSEQAKRFQNSGVLFYCELDPGGNICRVLIPVSEMI